MAKYLKAEIGVLEPYDLGFEFLGLPTTSQEIFRSEAVRGYTFPINLVGSTGNARIAATAETIFNIEKNGTPFGTATFAISASTCTFVAATETSFIADTDVITVVAPATPDATLEDISFHFKGTR